MEKSHVAKLTDTLNDASPTSRNIVEPIMGANIGKAVFDFLGDKVDGVARIGNEMEAGAARKTAAARQQRVDAAADQVSLDGTSALYPEFNQAPTLPAITNNLEAAQSAKAAEEQGKRPNGSAAVIFEQKRLQFLRDHPDMAAEYDAAAKAMGFDNFNTRMHTFEQAQKLEDDRNKATNDVQIGYVQKAGAAGYATGDFNIDASNGQKLSAAEYQFDLASKSATLALTKANTDKAVSEQLQRDADKGLNAAINGEADVALGSVLTSATQLFTSAGNDTDQMKALEHVQTVIGPAIDNKINELIMKARRGGSSEDNVKALRESMINTYKKPAIELFTGDNTAFAARTRTLAKVQQDLKIGVTEALPIYTAVAAAYGPMFAQTYLGTLSPEAIKALKEETSGFNTQSVYEHKKTEANIAAIVSGNANFKDMTPAEAKSTMASVYPTVISLGKALGADPKSDPNSKDFQSYTNATGKILNAITEFQPQSIALSDAVKSTTFVTSATGLALDEKNIANGTTKEVGLASVKLKRVNAERLIEGLILQPDNSTIHTTRYDPVKGVFVIDTNTAAAAKANASILPSGPSNFGGAGNLVTGNGGSIPANIRQKVQALNANLDFLIASNKHDDNLPKGATPIQLRAYFAQHTPVPSNGPTKANPRDSWFKAAADLDTALTKAATTQPSVSEKPSTGRVADLDKSDYGSQIVVTAQKYDVPVNVIEAVLGTENTGLNPNAQGPLIKTGTHAGDRAKGLFQLMGKTAQGLGVDRDTVEGNIEGGIKLLSQNFKRFGNWRDAISAYHSGVSYNEAKKQGRTDGGKTTVSYVDDILAAAGLS